MSSPPHFFKNLYRQGFVLHSPYVNNFWMGPSDIYHRDTEFTELFFYFSPCPLCLCGEQTLSHTNPIPRQNHFHKIFRVIACNRLAQPVAIPPPQIRLVRITECGPVSQEQRISHEPPCRQIKLIPKKILQLAQKPGDSDTTSWIDFGITSRFPSSITSRWMWFDVTV